MDNVNVLVVEDDESINNMVTKALKKENFNVKQAYDGSQALILWQENDFNIILLDIMLPVIDGIEVMRRIREKSTIPIILLTAKGDESDRVIGLGLGADDYIVKPFYISELTARVKAQLRRCLYFSSSLKSRTVLQYKDIEFDTESFIVKKRGEVINLTAKECKILKLFLENLGKVFTKVQIFNEVWGDEYLGDDNTVMVHIRRLRNKIEDDPDKPKYIKSLWGIGYKMGDNK